MLLIIDPIKLQINISIAEIHPILLLPMGLNSPTESEFRFSYFIFLRCPSGILRDLIT